MLKLLSIALILIFVASKFNSFKSVVQGKTSLKENIWMIVIFSILRILASYFVLDVNGVPGNVRGFVVMISALIAGPYVGIPVALISGGWRFLLRGSTALPCTIGTILAGLIGSLVYKFNDRKLLSMPKSAIFMFLFSGLDMFIIATLASNGIAIANAFYDPMTFTAVVGILLYKFITEK